MTGAADEPATDALGSSYPGSRGGGTDLRLAFVAELDRLKTVVRRTRLADGSRYENTAEHSWHLAMMALTLAPDADDEVDVARVVELLLVHDVVEIDADDTFVYDLAGRESKAAREQAAADRIFGLLPADEGARLRAAWTEYESGDTPEGWFARAVDRFQPVLLNHANDGGSWVEHGIRADQVLATNRGIAGGSLALWQRTLDIVDEAVERGWLLPPAGEARDDVPGPPPELHTERLVLRWPRLTDAPAILAAYAGDERVTRFMTWTPHTDVASLERDYLRDAVRRIGRGTEPAWLVHLDGEVVGMVSTRPGAHGHELGYVLSADHWGRGIMPEAVEAVTSALHAVGVERVYAYTDVENAGSARVLEKAGFVEEGVLRAHMRVPHLDGPRDSRLFARTRP